MKNLFCSSRTRDCVAVKGSAAGVEVSRTHTNVAPLVHCAIWWRIFVDIQPADEVLPRSWCRSVRHLLCLLFSQLTLARRGEEEKAGCDSRFSPWKTNWTFVRLARSLPNGASSEQHPSRSLQGTALKAPRIRTVSPPPTPLKMSLDVVIPLRAMVRTVAVGEYEVYYNLM